jgi:hypothetical protein
MLKLYNIHFCTYYGGSDLRKAASEEEISSMELAY